MILQRTSVTAFDRVASARLVGVMRDGPVLLSNEEASSDPRPYRTKPLHSTLSYIELSFIAKLLNFHLAEVLFLFPKPVGVCEISFLCS